MKAIWNGAVIAESDDTVVVERSHYFPPDSIRNGHLRESSYRTVCGWKGTASYYDIVVGGETNENAAWYYPEALEAANGIRGYVAFWNGVEVVE